MIRYQRYDILKLCQKEYTTERREYWQNLKITSVKRLDLVIGKDNPFYKQTHSTETKKKQSISHKIYYETNEGKALKQKLRKIHLTFLMYLL